MAIRSVDIRITHTATGDARLRTLADLEAPAGGGTIYAVSRIGGDGLTVVDLREDGRARRIDHVDLPDAPVAGTAAEAALLDDDRLLVTGIARSGGWIYDLDALGRIEDGAPARIEGLTGATMAPIAVEIDGRTHLYAGETGRGVLSHWTLGTDAHDIHTVAGSTGIADLGAVRAGGTHWLVAAGAGGDPAALFRLDGRGRAAEADRLTAAEAGQVGIAVPTALAVADVDGTAYAILAAAGSSSLTVLRLDPVLGLVPVDHVVDGLGTRFADVTSLAATGIGDDTYLAAAGSDDGLTVLRLLPGGRLAHVATLADGYDCGLADVSDLTLFEGPDGGLRVVAASEDETGLTVIDIDIHAGRGAVRIDDAGGDRLRGTEGADLFVLAADGAHDEVIGFEAGVDALDLSGWTFLRSTGQLEIEPTPDGARIAHGDETLRLISHDGRTLTVGDVLAADPLPLQRFLPGWSSALVEAIEAEPPAPAPAPGPAPAPAPAPAPGGPIWHRGTARAERLQGDARADILMGGGGADTLLGGGGADVFVLHHAARGATVGIADFETGDRLAIDDWFFGGLNTTVPRDVSEAMVRGALRSGRASYDRAEGELWLDRDGTAGPGEATLVARLDGSPVLSAEDVMLF